MPLFPPCPAGPHAALAARLALGVACATVLLLVACGSTPRGGGPRGGPLIPDRGDGVGPRPPANLEQVPDAVPRVERVPPGGPNRPYEVFGRSYTPITNDRPFTNDRPITNERPVAKDRPVTTDVSDDPEATTLPPERE